MIKRIGFACKWIDHADQVNGIGPRDDAKKYNTGTTTIAWLNRQTRAVAEQKLWDLMCQNLEATRKLVERVGNLEENLRMVRLGSDMLPAYTEPTWSYFWRRADVTQYLETHFGRIGDLARERAVRLSFHPGQFCVLASDNPNIVNRSVEEFEYHATMATWMGFGRSFQDFKINVHISGRQGPQGVRRVLGRLSPEARNCITIENEEISYGIDDCLSIADCVPIVLDIHHNWCHSGQYIRQDEDRVKRIIDSWRGVRPVCHYSVSREEYLVGHSTDVAPDFAQLMESGHKRQKLRAHSDFMWNNAVNTWALGFLDSHDIMVESKAKNLASFELAKLAKQLNIF